MTSQKWTRRQAIKRSGALIAGVAGLAASPGLYRPKAGSVPVRRAPTATVGTAIDTADTTAAPQFWNFVSNPALTPPVITVTSGTDGGSSSQLGSGYVFVGPRPSLPSAGLPGGSMIMDWDGNVVWYTSRGDDLTVQSYQGNPVLTWFLGLSVRTNSAVYTSGHYVVADQTYTQIATINAVGSDYSADGHECFMSSRGTAYITVRRQVNMDLTAVGGPAAGTVLDCGVQEIDVATGNLLFQWNALDNIPLDETQYDYSSPGAADPYHFNSIAIAPDGNLLISARNTWTVYKVSRSTGAIIWRLGGKRSSFAMGPGTAFAWQHDARPVEAVDGNGCTMISIFDDEATPQVGPQSRGIILSLDTVRMRTTLFREYTRPGGVLATYEGSMQVLSGGQVLVGWGNQPYITRFSPAGEVLWDAQYPVLGPPDNPYQSYRAQSYHWSGNPADSPNIAVTSGASDEATVFASWNGATAVARWTVLAGSDPSALAPVKTAARTGFETTIPVTTTGPYFAVAAKDIRGRELGRSNTAQLSTTSG